MQLTVGPLDPAVYWRRRAILGGAVVLVLVLLIVLLVGGSSGASKPNGTSAGAAPSPTVDDTPTGSPTPSASPTGSPSASTSASASASTSAAASASPSASSASPSASAHSASDGCTTDQLTLVASTSKSVYHLGAHPVLAMTVRNTSPDSCTVDLGASQRELVITSGTAHTWSSKDCAPASGRAVTVLHPKQRVAFTVTWSGKRSQVGCKGDRPVASAGTYRLTAQLGTLTSTASVFRLT